MTLLRTSRLRILVALLAFALFGGCLIGDGIADAMHGCVADSEHQSSDDGCAMCFTCSHNGSLTGVEPAPVMAEALPACGTVVIADERALEGPPGEIDHPPQLA